MNNTLTTLRTALDSLFYLEMTARTGSSQLPESLLQAQAAITDFRTVIASMEAQEPIDKNQWWYAELQGFWGNADHVVTLDTRRAAKVALDHAQPSEPKSEPDCILCHGNGEHEMASAWLPGQPPQEKRMVKCRKCAQPKSEPAHDDLTIAYMSGFHDGKKAKAEPVQEPFGFFRPEPFGWTDCAETDEGAIALYEAAPQARKPLTAEQIDEAFNTMEGGPMGFMKTWGYMQFARAIEAAIENSAHGIEGGAT